MYIQEPFGISEFNTSIIWHGNINEVSLTRDLLSNSTDISPLIIQSIAGTVKVL